MTLTLLLDLDDTLLGNEATGFVNAYMKLLGEHLARFVDPAKLVQALWAGTMQMNQSQRPDATLEEVFDHIFYPALGLRKEDLAAELAHFYKEIFPRLQSITHTLPETAALFEAVAARGWHVGIATEPFFPLLAIQHRVSWSGAQLDDPHIRLIPSFQTFHFSKRTPAYYAEFLGRMGWPDGPILMVGNSLESDILPARALGLATYWIEQPGAEIPSVDYTPTGSGTLAGLLDWIDAQPEGTLTPDFSSPSALRAILRATPAVFDTLARTLPEAAWRSRPAPDEWCRLEVVCHLRDVDQEVNLPRLLKMAEELNPFIPGSDTDPWVVEREYIKQDYQLAIKDFCDVRMKILALLDNLQETDWNRTARHAIFGPTTLREVVQIISSHDRLHIQQANPVESSAG